MNYATFHIANDALHFQIDDAVQEQRGKGKHYKKTKVSINGRRRVQSQGERVDVDVELAVDEAGLATLRHMARENSPVRLLRSQLHSVEEMRKQYATTQGQDLVIGISEIKVDEAFISEQAPQQSMYYVSFKYRFNWFND